jgi:protein-S-isoprenylcysteine O-methyltransferase Ste14
MEVSRKRGPKIRIPPAFFLAGFLTGILCDAVIAPIPFVGGVASPRSLIVVGWIVVWLGVAISLTGIVTFRLAGTPMFPFSPARRVVRHGPYRFTRNPMYLGATVTYLGFALVLNTAWPVLLLPLVLWGLVRYVIRVEEAYLEQLFGAEYVDYKKSVRRWL